MALKEASGKWVQNRQKGDDSAFSKLWDFLPQEITEASQVQGYNGCNSKITRHLHRRKIYQGLLNTEISHLAQEVLELQMIRNWKIILG